MDSRFLGQIARMECNLTRRKWKQIKIYVFLRWKEQYFVTDPHYRNTCLDMVIQTLFERTGMGLPI